MSNLDIGVTGAKRASWERVHFRDVGLALYRQHPKASLKTLARLFGEQMEEEPDYKPSVWLYVMANIKHSLAPKRRPAKARGRGAEAQIAALEEQVINKVVSNMLDLPMPWGSTLRESTKPQMRTLGRFGNAVADRMGRKPTVGDALAEGDVQAIYADVAKSTSKRSKRNG